MSYTILSPHLKSIADSANRTIKDRYILKQDAKVESSIDASIPFRPTLHWKTKTHYIACEVADRPFPKSIKESFADIVAANQPVRLIVAYPQDNGLSAKDYQDDVKQCKKFGIGYMSIDTLGNGNIEYPGISLSLYIPFPSDFSPFRIQVKQNIQDAYEHYLHKGDPDIGLQNLGQVVERLLLTSAEQAKAKSKFNYTGFKPPKFISQTTLINEMIKANVLDNGILGRCKDFAKARNSVSHHPKDLTEAKKIEMKLKGNFITGVKIIEDLPNEIIKSGYRIRM